MKHDNNPREKAALCSADKFTIYLFRKYVAEQGIVMQNWSKTF